MYDLSNSAGEWEATGDKADLSGRWASVIRVHKSHPGYGQEPAAAGGKQHNLLPASAV